MRVTSSQGGGRYRDFKVNCAIDISASLSVSIYELWVEAANRNCKIKTRLVWIWCCSLNSKVYVIEHIRLIPEQAFYFFFLSCYSLFLWHDRLSSWLSISFVIQCREDLTPEHESKLSLLLWWVHHLLRSVWKHLQLDVGMHILRLYNKADATWPYRWPQ